ncbi:hypothetical protein BASA83_007199 [Batrachochytrium salamandrivorans]|nr:hypothetical protein BASA83_007199 [Batrachochytrium salamandrivorans]
MKFNVLVVAAMAIASVNAVWYEGLLSETGNGSGRSTTVVAEGSSGNGQGKVQYSGPTEKDPKCADLETRLGDLWNKATHLEAGLQDQLPVYFNLMNGIGKSGRKIKPHKLGSKQAAGYSELSDEEKVILDNFKAETDSKSVSGVHSGSCGLCYCSAMRTASHGSSSLPSMRATAAEATAALEPPHLRLYPAPFLHASTAAAGPCPLFQLYPGQSALLPCMSGGLCRCTHVFPTISTPDRYYNVVGSTYIHSCSLCPLFAYCRIGIVETLLLLPIVITYHSHQSYRIALI